MAVSEGYKSFVLEQLGAHGDIRDKRMFGGVGIYAEELFFALISGDTLFFKVDDANRPDFEAAGMPKFQPYGEDGGSMNYYQVPADVLEDRDALAEWMDKAVDVARRAKAKKKPKAKK